MFSKKLCIIIGIKNYSEKSAIVKLLTEDDEVCISFLKNISKKERVNFAIGNLIDANLTAKTENQMPNLKAELVKSYSYYLISKKEKLYCLRYLISIVNCIFYDQEKHQDIFVLVYNFLQNLKSEFNLVAYLELEFKILAKMGYSLDFTKCVVTGVKTNLTYLSPRSGRAVSYEAGKQYKNKLFPLPQFLVEFDIKENQQYKNIDKKEIKLGFNISSYFLQKYIFKNDLQIKDRQIFIESFKL